MWPQNACCLRAAKLGNWKEINVATRTLSSGGPGYIDLAFLPSPKWTTINEVKYLPPSRVPQRAAQSMQLHNVRLLMVPKERSKRGGYISAFFSTYMKWGGFNMATIFASLRSRRGKQ